MTIKKYNVSYSSQACNHNHHKKKTGFKKNKKLPYSRYLPGAIVAVLLLAAGNLFIDLPFRSLHHEGQEQEVQSLSPGATPASVFPSAIEGRTVKSAVGVQEIKNEPDPFTLRHEQLVETELYLKYQREQMEKIKTISGSLASGETIYQYLVKKNISPAEILRLQEKLQSVVDISYLNVGTKFSVHCTDQGKIVQFDYQPNQLDVYHIKIPDNEMERIEVTKDEIFREIVCFEGEIKSSLYEAMIDYCNSGQLAVQLAEIFAWDIDFLTECQSGDTFKILVEKLYRGDFYRWGDILAAFYEGEMLSVHTAVLFEDSGGHSDYYDEEGRCLRKAFLRAPLTYKYISSGYTQSRYHPILRIWRPHLAIDYAAPSGTPVVSIGSGTVISRYYDQGGYGNYVQIRHPNGYVTGYGHLSKFAKGLQAGQRIEQGEIIGYVGATGLATGPHLDFSISKDGKRINFLNLELPPATSIGPEYLEDFETVKQNYLAILK